MNLKYYYKVNNQGRPILGSNIAEYFKPAVGKWKEIDKPCCVDTVLPCNCKFRYYVKIDYQGKPINYSLIKRTRRPESDSERFMEIPSDVCCVIPVEPVPEP